MADRFSSAPKSLLGERSTHSGHLLVKLFVIVPTLAWLASVPLAWGWGLISIVDIALATAFYVLSCLGVTAGYHRHFTHGSFKANRGLRIALAIAAGFSVQGGVVDWVADHRRHHAFSDKEGDPHSPWKFGTTLLALVRGFIHAHMGWLFNRDKTNASRFAPDLLADRDIKWIQKLFPLWIVLTFTLPALMGGLITWSWSGALTAFFWAGFVRVAVLHHTTWSVNSICHMVGSRPFNSRDKSANFWPMAIISMGESWHNSHHADPTCARHGVLRGQVDITARMIRLFEKLGWAWDVRWPNADRLAKLSVSR